MSRYFEENTLNAHLTKMLIATALNNTEYKTYASNVYRDIAVNRLSIWLEYAPKADVVEVKHGKWIKDRLCSTSGGTYGVRRCSVCEDYYQDIGYGWNCCPNCGARMDGEEDVD